MYFTADTHFNHAKILQHMKRPFSSIEEMNEIIIQNWNRVIKRKHTEIYFLGDFGFHTKKDHSDIEALRKRLNGDIIFIQGNHDDHLIKLDCWERIYQCKYMKSMVRGTKLFLCHYAMRTWRGSHRGSYNLHGHSHGQLPDDGTRRFDVGVDCNNFTPVHFDQIHERLKDRPFLHHHIFDAERVAEMERRSK